MTDSDFTQHAYDVLGESGPFASHLSHFTPRPSQQEMAATVATAIESDATVIVEAATGTGKTLAYLVPALLSGKKILISTGTKNLQDQLFLRDLPLAQKTLAHTGRIALLKGRANYLCHHRLERNAEFGRFTARELVTEFSTIKSWASTTRSGDISEVANISENSAIWPLVTSTAENCLGSDCKFFDKCSVNHARQQAQAADVVVVNHHLFFADLSLKEEGVAQLLPHADVLIFDEAHQLPETATHFFGNILTGRQLADLCVDVLSEVDSEAPDAKPQTSLAVFTLQQELANLQQLFLTINEAKGNWLTILDNREYHKKAETMEDALRTLSQQLAPLAVRSKGLEQCLQRSEHLQQNLSSFFERNPDFIYWYEARKTNFALHATPLDISKPFVAALNAYKQSWIFTSATLSVKDDFSFFSERLGLQDAKTFRWDSPFDYENISLLYVPKALPAPSEINFTSAMIEAIVPVINACKGRTFVLFTSHRALREVAQKLPTRISYPVLVQGTASKRGLLQQFTEHGNSVLLGTSSFWEGVDIRGEALSCVIIDKLPFASPGDPVTSARINHMRDQQLEPFYHYQIPQAVIALRQGIGRLIRDENDSGLLMICDSRLLQKSYGKIFLQSLPRMPITRNLSDVTEFFQPVEATP